ncbi:MAG: N-6 DNA methylase [Bacteroidales bacterium]|nr:N-6 DNA methylase [Bacteroidales bacterium]
MKNLLEIFNNIGIHKDNGLFITSENKWQQACMFSNRIERLIANKLKPDAFFCFDSKPLILFYESPQNIESIHKAIWNFNESPIIIIAEDNEVEIFNGFKYINDEATLSFLGDKEILNDFNYFEIVTGKVWEKYQTDLSYTNRVDYHLLKNIKAASLLLNNDGLEQQIVNALIGKVIFVRYLIDRKVKIGYNGENKYWSNADFCSILSKRKQAIGFFKYLEDKFNGDMFLLDSKNYDLLTPDCFNVIISLLNEDDLGSGQQSLFKLYDFSIIPIEFISNVYESFIGEKNQEKEGAYYTPLFLVDYILKETVENYLTKNLTKYNCKVLDPACGSGIFLVETLRKIIERFIELNPDVKEDSEEFKETIKSLAVNNIYGVDKNISAIQVAIFSIQLTLLDYQKPASVENFRFPKLLNTNFFEADFFNMDHEFNSILNEIQFHFILGNPPWKRGKGEKEPLFLKYINERKKREKKEIPLQDYQIKISNSEIAQAFLLRISDFHLLQKVSFIVTSKVLYNLNGKDFRKYFLNNYLLEKVFELAPVRHQIFNNSSDPSVAPAAILFYKPCKKENIVNNIIDHITLKPSRFFSMFKIFSLNRSDFKKVAQIKLLEYDWLWKTLVYGTYFDFNLLLRLKSKYSSIEKELQDTDRFIKGQGVMIGGGDENDSTHLKGLPYLNTRKDIKPYWINEDINSRWDLSIAHRPRKEILFKAPMLLITGGISNKFKSVSAVSNIDVVYRSSLTSIKAVNKKDINGLKVMSAILNSSFFAYYALQTFSSIGIEREESHDDEKWTIPYMFNLNIEKQFNAINELEGIYYTSKNNVNSNEIRSKIDIKISELDDSIFEIFNISESEKSLINYANDYVIPIQMDHDGSEKLFHPMLLNDKILEDYAELFIARFKKNIDNNNQKFIVEIWHSKQIVGMFFKVVPNTLENSNDIVWIDKSKDGILPTILKLTSEKVTDKLFVQKDLRGFEKEYFYLFKPNEKRLWHKAIGYLDVEEFMDAILKAGRSGK